MAVLILGATSPIATAVARVYAARNEAICVAARDLEEARAIASDLSIRSGKPASAFAFDARDFDAHQALIEQVEAAHGPITIALLAFGAMGDQQASEEDFEQAQAVIEINYTGAVSVCEQLAARMAERKSGTIIGIASVAGDRGRASNYIYGSAKGAFALYLQGLRNRLAAEGVNVLTVKLGFVDTRMTFELKTAIPIANPQDAANAIVRAADRGVEVLYYPLFWKGIMTVIKAIPEKVFKRLSL